MRWMDLQYTVAGWYPEPHSNYRAYYSVDDYCILQISRSYKSLRDVYLDLNKSIFILFIEPE